MTKEKDQILSMMRAASSKNFYSDLHSRFAILRSLDFWNSSDTRDTRENDRMLFFFFLLIVNQRLFKFTDKAIANELFISEKTVRNYRNKFKVKFYADYMLAHKLSPDTLTDYCEVTLKGLGLDATLARGNSKPKSLYALLLQNPQFTLNKVN